MCLFPESTIGLGRLYDLWAIKVPVAKIKKYNFLSVLFVQSQCFSHHSDGMRRDPQLRFVVHQLKDFLEKTAL